MTLRTFGLVLRQSRGEWVARGSRGQTFSVGTCSYVSGQGGQEVEEVQTGTDHHSSQSHKGLFKFKLIKISKIKHLVPQSPISSAIQPHIASAYSMDNQAGSTSITIGSSRGK